MIKPKRPATVTRSLPRAHHHGGAMCLAAASRCDGAGTGGQSLAPARASPGPNSSGCTLPTRVRAFRRFVRRRCRKPSRGYARKPSAGARSARRKGTGITDRDLAVADRLRCRRARHGRNRFEWASRWLNGVSARVTSSQLAENQKLPACCALSRCCEAGAIH